MTSEQLRYMHARQRFESAVVNPAIELLAATAELGDSYKHRAETAEKLLEQMRPLWAQGFSNDSEAAQAHANALSEIWNTLGVDNQTAAMAKLRILLA